MFYSDTLKWDLCIMLKLSSVTVQEYAVSYYRYINTFLSIIDNKWQIFNERTESLSLFVFFRAKNVKFTKW